MIGCTLSALSRTLSFPASLSGRFFSAGRAAVGQAAPPTQYLPSRSALAPSLSAVRALRTGETPCPAARRFRSGGVRGPARSGGGSRRAAPSAHISLSAPAGLPPHAPQRRSLSTFSPALSSSTTTSSSSSSSSSPTSSSPSSSSSSPSSSPSTPPAPSARVAKLLVNQDAEGGDKLEMTWADGHRSIYHAVWLLDHNPAHFEPSSHQRQRSVLEIDPRARIRSANVSDAERDGETGSLHLQIGDETVVYPLTWLREHCYSAVGRRERQRHREESQCLWDAATLQSCRAEWELDYGSWVDEAQPRHLRAGLRALHKFGLLVLRNVPSDMDSTRKIAERIGFPRETLFGTMWDTMPKEVYNDTAYTNLALSCHTDGTYFHCPHGIQLFNCVRNDALALEPTPDRKTGVSLLMDGFKIAEVLAREHPETHRFCRDVKLRFHHTDDESQLHARAPILEYSSTGELLAFRFNQYDLTPLTYLPFDDVPEYYRHIRVVTEMVTTRRDLISRLQLTPGMALFVNNTRVLHGREAFEGLRNLMGCYIGRDEFESALKIHAVDHAHRPL